MPIAYLAQSGKLFQTSKEISKECLAILPNSKQTFLLNCVSLYVK